MCHSVQFNRSVVSNSLRPYELQHTRPPCPSPTAGVYLNSCPLSRWCHPTISSPVVLFSSCLQSFPASESFPMSQLFHIEWPKYWNFSFSISLSNEHSGLISFRIDWFDLLKVQGTLKNLLQHHSLKASVLWCSAIFMVELSHSYMATGKTIALTIWTLMANWCLCFLICCLGSSMEMAMASHSSALAWKIPWMEEPGSLQSMRSQRVGHDWATSLSVFTSMHWRRKWQPIPVFLPEESQGRGSLVGCRLCGCTELDTTEAT